MKTTASTGESRLKANVTNILGKDKWILTAGIQGSTKYGGGHVHEVD